jgi:hypothetical protein
MKFRILVFRVLVSLLLGGLTLDVGTSLAGGSRDSVEDLTRQLLTLHVQSQRGVAVARTTALTALVSVAATRQDRLAALIADHPDLVLRHALPSAVRATLAPAVQPYIEEEQEVEGELEVLHEDSAGGSRYLYTMQAGGQRLALHFAADAPALQTGDRVRAAGVRVRQAMAVASGQSQLTVLSLLSSSTFGAQKMAVILVNFQDHPTQTWVSAAQAHDIVFGTGSATSVTNFYREASYQQAWLSGEVYGVYTIPVFSTGCDTTSIATYAKQAATAEVGATKMATFTRFVYAFPSSGCSWWGLGTVGGNPSQAWIAGSFQNGVVAHEVGHNFGLYHSHALDCGAASIGSNCIGIEYGDMLDVMGSASPPKHFNAVQKEMLGWLNYGASPPLTTVQTSGVYTLDPYESPGSNSKALKVRTPSGDWYYVEYRQAIGFDASTVSTNANVKNGIVLHLLSQQNPNRIYLLDMTPATSSWSDPALEMNATFSDETAGITIAPAWVNSTAGVSVTVGGGVAPCVRSNPSVAVSPAQQQGPPGTSLSYTVAVTNKDTTACPASTFAPQATTQAGWTVTFSAAASTIAPGATGSTTMQVKSPASASSGPYAISLTASNASAPSYSGSSTAMYTVATGGSGAAGTFTDVFSRDDSSTLGNGWTQVSGSLMIQGRQARNAAMKTSHTAVQATLVGATQIVSGSFASMDNNSGPRFGLILRYKDPQNYYTCYRQAGGSSLFRIAKVVNGMETVLKWGTIQNPVKGALFSFDCGVQGSGPGTKLTLSFNGATKLTVSDSTFPSGSVGMSIGYQSGGPSVKPVSNAINKFTATVTVP